MKLIGGLALLFFAGTATAKEPVSIGEGQYMLSEQNFTIFGSTDKIVVKLMKRANEYCAASTGKQAVLSRSSGTESEPGVFNENGGLRRGATGATGTIYFRCGEGSDRSGSRQKRYEELAALKALLDSGALTNEEFDAEKAKLLGE